MYLIVYTRYLFFFYTSKQDVHHTQIINKQNDFAFIQQRLNKKLKKIKKINNFVKTLFRINFRLKLL